ncbi:MAG: bifunctional diaminohydroxyphosphoribosylaminopyrimidine deaminase/5-amino-6-(5-phosphoribosylamino)uracil reductase RibD [Pseudomonadota bacterium]
MRMALGLAKRGLGRVAPNPAVGCVLVRPHHDGARVLGRASTAVGGRPHAETQALDQARARYGAEALQGATAYVTLEPCAHHGRTPPCAEALAHAGIARLVCPLLDPDPRVSGRGFAHLRAAGITVETGLLAAEARAVNAGFLSRIERRRPWLTLKLATTLDARIATATGESRWITGGAARRRVHLMRAEADAVLIGSGTALADDPLLDVRDLGLESANPVRVVIDGALSLAPESRLGATAQETPVWVLHRQSADPERRAALAATGIQPLACPETPEAQLDLTAALTLLAEAGLTRVLCEGGGRLGAALIEAGLVDEIALFQAGRLLGSDAIPALGPLGLDRLAAAPVFERVHIETLGPDLFSLWRRS